jgi:hypothetical protein
MIMTTSGGMGPEMSMALKQLAQKLSAKQNEPYSKVMGTLRVRFVFAMMRSALVCLRGSRTIKPRTFDLDAEEILDSSSTVVVHEARLL